jgi:RNA polymerase sigma-70 factor (ECF subfamily)
LLEEQSIIAAVRARNPDAFGVIVEYYQAPIIRYLYRLTGDKELARDMAQDTFVQAYRSMQKTDPALHLKAWLYRIATNRILQHSRRKRMLTLIPIIGPGKARSPAMETAPDDTGDRMVIQEALCKVRLEQRVCLVLHFIEGLKYREIGAVMEMSEDDVRQRVARGKESFKIACGGVTR